MNNVTSFRFRWFVENCSQIELPNGKVIVIDPIFFKDENDISVDREKSFICGYGPEVIERCDYILLTHIHFDHTGSLKNLQERFKCPILVNGWSAFELVKHLDLPTGSVIPMTDGCEYNFDDFRILWQQGRHTTKIGEFKPSFLFGETPEEAEYLHFGTTYHSNFIIKLNNGDVIAMDGGAFEPHMNELEKYHPTVVLRHAERVPEECAAHVAQQMARSNAKYLFLLTMQILQDPKVTVDTCNQKLAEDGINGRVVLANPGQWVTFYNGASVE